MTTDTTNTTEKTGWFEQQFNYLLTGDKPAKRPYNLDPTKVLVLNWDDDLKVGSREILCEMFAVSSTIASKTSSDVDSWLQDLLQSSLKRKSNGYATLEFNN